MTATEELRRLLDELDKIADDEFEAAFGRGECRVESMHGYTDPFTHTRYSVDLSCHTIDDWGDSEPPDYCPYCGKKVVSE